MILVPTFDHLFGTFTTLACNAVTIAVLQTINRGLNAMILINRMTRSASREGPPPIGSASVVYYIS